MSLTPSERLRYGRHLVLPQFGDEGQEKLKAGSVLIVGAGGLGSPAALYLAAAGVGRIGLVDFDVVDVSNLQRQVLYGHSDIGRAKLDVAGERLHDLNPHVDLIMHGERLDSSNALEILAGYDVVLDGTDNFATRYLLSDACVLLGKPDVYGSIFRFEGQLSVFDARRGPCYRCLYPEPPPPQLVPDCAEGGVLGVLPGIIGSLQANEAIKLLAGIGEPLTGTLLLFDALRSSFRRIRLSRKGQCRACGTNPTIRQLIDYDQFCAGGVVEDLKEVDANELKEMMDSGRTIRLIDVREPHEWDAGHIEGAEHIPVGQLPARVGELKQDEEIVLYCRGGGRSGRALAMLQQAGFSKAKHLRGGIGGWAKTIDPSIKVV
jgi:molybdopterin/thiamine biosynthesis adenylyltransferase/rhodanese-related sulfurtransferase